MSNSNLPLEALASTANSYAAAHGIQVEKKWTNLNVAEKKAGTYFECAPISMLPNAFPRETFEQVKSVAPAFNLLVDRISRDATFLTETLGGSVSDADPYTAKLLQLYQEIYGGDTPNAFAVSADRLGIQRSDYMLHKPPTPEGQGPAPVSIKQVELNTIASSFASLSTRVADLHRNLVARYASNDPEDDDSPLATFLQTNKGHLLGSDQAALVDTDGVPSNPALDRLPLAMKVSVERYRERFAVQGDKKNLIVLFVCQEGESNTVDQRLLEFQLFAEHGIPVVRCSLTQLATVAQVNSETGALTLQLDDSPPLEVALVYYRAGYAPTDYPAGYDGVEWQARHRLEASRATKCPSLGYHLAGTKKVQQALARPGALERFFPQDDDAGVVAQLLGVFAGLYSLDAQDVTDTDLQAVRDVLDSNGQDRYVLKPQREGGGYNFYGQQLADKLQSLVTRNKEGDSDDLVLQPALGEYILMERLFPPQQEAILMRGGLVEGQGMSVSECGIFGTILCGPTGSEVLHNEYAGFLLRTKFSNVDEGGVASGFATLSSPYLCSPKPLDR